MADAGGLPIYQGRAGRHDGKQMREMSNNGPAQKFAILRTGSFTSMEGARVIFSMRDLRDVVDSYDPVSDPAPLVIGHPATDDPAYGWVSNLSVENDKVMASVTHLDRKFAESVRGGRYRKVSVRLFPPDSPSNPKPGKYYLKHVGFLGGAAPAITGLGTASFSSQEVTTISLMEHAEIDDFVCPRGYTVLDRDNALYERASSFCFADSSLSLVQAASMMQHEGRDGDLNFAAPRGYDVDHSQDELYRAACALQASEPGLGIVEAAVRIQRSGKLH